MSALAAGTARAAELGTKARPLKFVDFVHVPEEVEALVAHLRAATGLEVEVQSVPGDVSAPSDARAVAMFGGGGADFGCM